jgi:hypothetical protein
MVMVPRFGGRWLHERRTGKSACATGSEPVAWTRQGRLPGTACRAPTAARADERMAALKLS